MGREGIVVWRFRSHLLFVAMFCAGFGAAAFGAENYQTDIGPTPRDGRNSEAVQGRGSVRATLNGNVFSLSGKFAGLAGAATDAHLCLGYVMGGTGPAIGDITVSQAQSGDLSGTFTLTPEQVAALNGGKLYVILNSQKAPKGNLWGWFQPAHITVGPDVPQQGNWYIPNLLNDENKAPVNKRVS
jgi:hypothetical protein